MLNKRTVQRKCRTSRCKEVLTVPAGSRQRYCLPCQYHRQEINTKEMRSKSGRIYKKWMAGLIRSAKGKE